MQNRTPVPRDERPPLPAFDPVPRRYRHDGWTPERQKAFVEALADTGCVSLAARMVNMSPVSAYYLRRQPGAGSFRLAWEAALDFGMLRMKDIAFERAIEGQLVPVFVAGKLIGFRRKKNDRLLMFILRHFGTDPQGRRVRVDYFRGRDSDRPRDAASGRGGARAPERTPAAAAGVRTTVSVGPALAPTPSHIDRQAELLDSFDGVPLDEAAQAEILAALAACAERRRALAPGEDPDEPFVGAGPDVPDFMGELETGAAFDDFIPFREGELGWEGMGEGGPNEEIARVVAEIEARRAAMTDEEREAEKAERTRAVESIRAEAQAQQRRALSPPPDPNDPRLDWRHWQPRAEAAAEPAAGAGERAPTPAKPARPAGAARRPYKKRAPKPPFAG